MGLGHFRVILCAIRVGTAIVLAALTSHAHADELSDSTVEDANRQVRQLLGTPFPNFSIGLRQAEFRNINIAERYFLKAVAVYLPTDKVIAVSDQVYESGKFKLNPNTLGVLVHEMWHSYFDQQISSAQKAALVKEWDSKYRGQSVPSCFGNEGMGVYIQGLVMSYAQAAQATSANQGTPLAPYEEAYSGKTVEPYCHENFLKPMPMTPFELKTARTFLNHLFPDPDHLQKTLEARFHIRPKNPCRAKTGLYRSAFLCLETQLEAATEAYGISSSDVLVHDGDQLTLINVNRKSCKIETREVDQATGPHSRLTFSMNQAESKHLEKPVPPPGTTRSWIEKLKFVNGSNPELLHYSDLLSQKVTERMNEKFAEIEAARPDRHPNRIESCQAALNFVAMMSENAKEYCHDLAPGWLSQLGRWNEKINQTCSTVHDRREVKGSGNSEEP